MHTPFFWQDHHTTVQRVKAWSWWVTLGGPHVLRNYNELSVASKYTLSSGHLTPSQTGQKQGHFSTPNHDLSTALKTQSSWPLMLPIHQLARIPVSGPARQTTAHLPCGALQLHPDKHQVEEGKTFYLDNFNLTSILPSYECNIMQTANKKTVWWCFRSGTGLWLVKKKKSSLKVWRVSRPVKDKQR